VGRSAVLQATKSADRLAGQEVPAAIKRGAIPVVLMGLEPRFKIANLACGAAAARLEYPRRTLQSGSRGVQMRSMRWMGVR